MPESRQARPELSRGNRMQATCIIFSFLVATLKEKKKTRWT